MLLQLFKEDHHAIPPMSQPSNSHPQNKKTNQDRGKKSEESQQVEESGFLLEGKKKEQRG